MEERMNENHIGIETVYSWGKDKIEPERMDPAIPGATDGIEEKPEKKS
jgi:hypothetical protein